MECGVWSVVLESCVRAALASYGKATGSKPVTPTAQTPSNPRINDPGTHSVGGVAVASADPAAALQRRCRFSCLRIGAAALVGQNKRKCLHVPMVWQEAGRSASQKSRVAIACLQHFKPPAHDVLIGSWHGRGPSAKGACCVGPA